MPSDSKFAVLVVAAGTGVRAGGGVPKQYRLLGGQPLLARTLVAFAQNDRIAKIVPVIGAGQNVLFEKALATMPEKWRERISAPVIGGETRQASVRNGLEFLRHAAPSHVLIHDGARALVSPALVARTLDAVLDSGAVVPGLAILDTVKSVDAAGTITSTLERNVLRVVQTPQAFEFALISDAHARASAQSIEGLTDDAAVAEWAGHQVHVIEGESGNMKITTAEDFEKAEKALLQSCADVRVGQGYDVHAFVPGDHVWLGGVKIPHNARLNGHSDADVLLHALVDAILGALGDGDIGVHFPPSDEKWRGAASRMFLEDAVARVAARGGLIAHLDGSIICEGPKIGPHREAIRATIAEISGISLDRVGLKATTSEKLGFLGRSEGIAAFATATIRLP